MSLDGLPPGVLQLVLKQLAPRDVARAAVVCRSLAEAARDEQVWLHFLTRDDSIDFDGCPPGSTAQEHFVTSVTSELHGWGVGLNGSCLNALWGWQVRDRVSLPQPLPVSISASDDPLRPKAVRCGADFCIVLDWRGQVTDSRCLVHSVPDPLVHLPRQTSHLPKLWSPGEPIRVISAGGDHASAVDSSGRVWTWGCNKHSQAGVQGEAWLEWPAVIFEPPDAARAAASVCCAERHTVVLLQSGELLASGCNSHGQCAADQSQSQVARLSRMRYDLGGPPLGRAIQVSCGANNSAVVTDAGLIFVCGDNSCGQVVGLGPQSRKAFTFHLCGPLATWHGMPRAHQRWEGGGGQAAARVTQSACGDQTIYALCNTGEVYSWGAGSSGQLGVGGAKRQAAAPAKLASVRNAGKVGACGSGAQAAVIDAHGKVYTFGANKFGQLGHGDTNKRAVARCVKGLRGRRVEDVHFGRDFALAVCSWRGGQVRAALGGKEQEGTRVGALESGPEMTFGYVDAGSALDVEEASSFLEGADLLSLEDDPWDDDDMAARPSRLSVTTAYLAEGRGREPLRVGGRLFKKAMWRLLADFANDPSQTTMRLPPGLSGNQRRMAHLLAEQMGFEHTSRGEGPNRALHITKLRQEGPRS